MKRIDANQWVKLNAGDIVRFGTASATKEENFLFEVIKNVVSANLHLLVYLYQK